MTYFDWNATAPLLDAARLAWLEASASAWANPSTAYRAGVQARLHLEEAREWLAERFGVHQEQVIFTSGATEGCNGFLREAARQTGPEGEVWFSAVEHPAVKATATEYWGKDRVRMIPVVSSGVVDLDWITDRMEARRPALLCLMAANNETGVVQPWQAVLEVCRAKGVPFFCDAVQWAGKREMAGQPWNQCAGVVLSGHKFGAPKGVGCLILGPEWSGLKVQTGGAQEFASRSGTENVAAVLAMVAALRHRCENEAAAPLRAARDQFERQLETLWDKEIVVHGAGAERLWNTCLVALPEFPSKRWIARLDHRGFQVSSGSACSAGKSGPSSVLSAMGVEEAVARRTVRISCGWETAAADWDNLLEAIRAIRTELEETEKGDGPGQVIEI